MLELVLWGPGVPRKYPPHNYTTTTSMDIWYNAWWIHACMLFTPNSYCTIWMSDQKLKLIRAMFFQSFTVKFWWAHSNCSLCFLFGLPLLFKVKQVVHSEGCKEMLFKLLLPCSRSGHSPLPSGISNGLWSNWHSFSSLFLTILCKP